MNIFVILVMIAVISLSVTSGSAAKDWPGADKAANVDKKGTFSKNLSGLYYVSAAGSISSDIMYGIVNSPSILYKLAYNATTSYWGPVQVSGWSSGKSLTYPNGKGDPDTEDVTMDYVNGDVLYVCSERDNSNNTYNRLSVLSINLADTETSSTTVKTAAEWDLTADFPKTEINYGFEGIAWVDDNYLVSKGFIDESTGKAYDPAIYSGHGQGVVFLAHEGFATIHAYVLMPNGKFNRLASFASGQKTIASLYFDRETGYLWAECDNSSNGALDVHGLNAATGKFQIIASYDRPSSLPNYNNEGFTIAPESECDAKTQMKYVYWSNDDCDNGQAMWRDTIPCGQYI